jgi:hypothetical protein
VPTSADRGVSRGQRGGSPWPLISVMKKKKKKKKKKEKKKNDYYDNFLLQTFVAWSKTERRL